MRKEIYTKYHTHVDIFSLSLIFGAGRQLFFLNQTGLKFCRLHLTSNNVNLYEFWVQIRLQFISQGGKYSYIQLFFNNSKNCKISRSKCFVYELDMKAREMDLKMGLILVKGGRLQHGCKDVKLMDWGF